MAVSEWNEDIFNMQDVPLRCLGLKGIKESALYPGLLKKLIKIGGSPVGKSQVMRYLTLVHPSTKWFNITGKVVQNDRAVGSNASVYTVVNNFTRSRPDCTDF